MNKVIEMLMEELGVGICEDFRVKPSVAGQSEYKSIYHFDELGALRRDDGIPADSVLGLLVRGRLRIEKVKPKGRYIPKLLDTYYYVSDLGNILGTTNNEDESDSYIFEHNLVFRTKEEAEDYRWFLEQADKYKKEFVYGERNHCIEFYHDLKELIFGYYTSIRSQGTTYFGSKENIEEFRNIVGDERIKKYFFGAFE